jgi:hypothetical protein
MQMPSHEENKALRSATGIAAVVVATALLAGCYGPPRTHIVRTETIVDGPGGYSVVTLRPPAPRSELIPPAPNQRVVWDPGRWSWDGRGYVWVSGHYVDRPYERSVWEPGHWNERNGGWVWEEGHWRA